MSISVLSPANAYNPGSELWIFPELQKSQWTQRVDWYLNFQILKNSQRETLSIAEEVQAILKEAELHEHSIVTSPTDSNLMISSQQQLPNQWVVVVPGSEKLRMWMADIHAVWENLKKPTLRVFLPMNLSANAFVESWSLISESEDVTLVLDSDTKIRSNE